MNSRIGLFPVTAEVNKAGHLVIGGCDTLELAAKYGDAVAVMKLREASPTSKWAMLDDGYVDTDIH